MEFKALRVPSLTEEVAKNLGHLLENLAGVHSYTITTDTQELRIVFDENQLGFKTLVQEMAEVGCSLQNIDAALLL
jgi:hypothetical protein